MERAEGPNHRPNTIPEERSNMSSDISAMLLALREDLIELEKQQIVGSSEITGNDLPVGTPHRPTDARIYVDCNHEMEQGNLRDVDESGQPYVEMLFPGDTAKLILDQPPPAGHTAAPLVYNTHSKKAVVETDQDLLSDDEYKKHTKYVVTLIKDELNTWIDHTCSGGAPGKALGICLMSDGWDDLRIILIHSQSKLSYISESE